MKNCDRGLEIAARGHRPRAAFSSPKQITCLFFSCGNLALQVDLFTPSTNRRKKSNERKSE